MRIVALGLLLIALIGAPSQRACAGDVPTDDDVSAMQTRWEAAPGDVEAGIALQDALAARDRAKEAKTLFRRAANAQPKLPGLAFLYGRALGGKDGLRRMRKALEGGLDHADVPAAQRIAAWRAFRDALIEAEDLVAAEAAARVAVQLAAEAHDWTLLAWILEQRGSLDEAAKAYALAIVKREDHLWARNALALLRAKKGQLDLALELAQSTAERFPDAASAHLHLGLVASLSGDGDAGRAAYAKALECAGRDIGTLVAVANAYVDLEDHDLAHQALRRALAVDPENAQALVTAGVLALEQERLEHAVDFLSRAVKVARGDARAWYLLGLCRQRLGKIADALRAYAKACRLAPEVIEYRVALALAHAEAGSIDAGISALKRAIGAAPERADLHLQLGFLQMKRKRFRDAQRSMDRVAELQPEDPRPHFYLAIIYGDHLGKRREALRELETYAKLGGKEPAALRWLEQLRK